MLSINRLLVVPAIFGFFALGYVEPVAAKKAGPPPGKLVLIRDKADLFSKDAIEKADRKIEAIHRDFNKTLAIETFAEVPDDLKKKLEDKGKKEFFAEWANDRSRDLGVRGVYVLVSKDPKYYRTRVGSDTKLLLSQSKLDKILLDNFNNNEFDKGLLEAVDYVAAELQSNAPKANSSKKNTGDLVNKDQINKAKPYLSWICIGLSILLGVWLLFALIRAFTGGGNRGGPGGGPGGGGYGGGGGGGGGFMSSMLGGLFGAAAGMYLYNNFFGGSTPSAMGGSNPSAYGGDANDGAAGGGGGDYGDDAGGEDAGGGGGDWGADDGGGGGGDWGGGDAGGGGDWGGGGGDFGGGGGDW
jgi:uncharacterized protein